MRTWWLILWALICFGCSGAQAQDLSVAGTYTAVGTNGDGSQYHGRADVTEEGGIISLQMFNPEGERMSIALCLREGAVVSCVFQSANGAIGLASYVLDSRIWNGRWFVPGENVILTETLTPVDPKLHGAEQGPRLKL